MTDVARTPRRKRIADSNAESPSVAAEANEGLETRSMSVVFRAIVKAQTRALIFERLSAVAGDLFRGNESRPPQLLLKLPGGGAFPAELEDVCELECELARMASNERATIAKLMSSGVLAKAADADHDAVSGEPYEPTPDGGSVVENPTARQKNARLT